MFVANQIKKQLSLYLKTQRGCCNRIPRILPERDGEDPERDARPWE